jgi:hypothetical protein
LTAATAAAAIMYDHGTFFTCMMNLMIGCSRMGDTKAGVRVVVKRTADGSRPNLNAA